MRGGKRKGSGRKPGLNKITYATKLPRWIVAWLTTQTNQAKTIETALVEYYKINKPGPKTESSEGRRCGG